MEMEAFREDLFSGLPDDIALSILERLDLHSSARFVVLSQRWKHLPWLRSRLNLDINNFKGKSMAAFNKATESFLATTSTGQHVFECLRLKFHLTDDNHTSDVFKVLSNAIHTNKVKDLELDVMAEVVDYMPSESRAHFLMNFVGPSSNVFGWLKKLTIQHLSFAAPDLDNLLRSCKRLEVLRMFNCDSGIGEPWGIEAPESQLKTLIFNDCDFGVINLLCLPKLERVDCTDWRYSSVPLFLGSVPCLQQLHIVNSARLGQEEFKLSKLLLNNRNIEQLCLGFGAERIWIQEERAQLLRVSFSNLKIMYLTGIFFECDLSWTMLLLESAPVLEVLDIKVWKTQRNDILNRIYGENPKSISWEVSYFKHHHLKEFKLFGFLGNQIHLEFVRQLARRAVCLEQIFLVDNRLDIYSNAEYEAKRTDLRSKTYKYKLDHNGTMRYIRLTHAKKGKKNLRSSRK